MIYQVKYLFRIIIEEKDLISNNFSKYENGMKKINIIFDSIKKELETSISTIFSGQAINKIYKRIEPHKKFESLKYEITFNENGQPELYIKGASNMDNQEIIPELFFSSAQLNTVALSIFLGGALTAVDYDLRTIFIDDPIGHFDDINALAFVDLLRAIISSGKWQIIISTHDESLFNLFQNKISSDYYKSKFIKFSSVGVLEKIM
jgi:DNA repair exonuclease SbcCD ATPase subunit